MIADQRWAEDRLRLVEARRAKGAPVDRLEAEVRDRLEASAAEVVRRANLPLTITYPETLPVSLRREEILATLAAHKVVVLTGETGSGKTTQLPKMLLEAGYGRRGLLALTQPRRVAAVAMADRIREECAAGPGVIAHSVRFDDHATPDTVIRVLTDGLLLAEAAKDPDLSRYDAILVDEAHERSLNIDLLLGLLKLLRLRRPELAIVISSASIEAERFARYFNDEQTSTPIINVSGRLYPVDLRYRPPVDDDIGYLAATVSAIRELTDADESGDILVFLPTERDILEAGKRLDDLPRTLVLPLFGRLTPHEQQRVFQPAPGGIHRKIVLATNIAETSLTIPGIRFVVDAGLARFKRFQASTRTERLPIEAISRASATQRAGRAGRVEAGICIRLYSEEDLNAREPFTPPEVLRSNLAGVMLTCLSMGLGDPTDFPWLDAPAPGAWQQARNLLDELGALAPRSPGSGVRGPGSRLVSAGGSVEVTPTVEPGLRGTPDPGPRTPDTLSPLGKTLSAIPADPQVARILIAGLTEGCPHEACTIAAFLSVQDPRVRPLAQEAKADAAHKGLAHEAGDIATILRLWDRWEGAGSGSKRSRFCEDQYLGFRRMREWADVRHQLWSSLRDSRHGAALPPHGPTDETWPLEHVHRAVLAGMLGNVLMFDAKERSYRGAGERLLAVHPGSALRAGKVDDGKKAPPPAPWLVACEVVETSRLFARLCAPIDPQWVIDLAGDRVKRRHRDPHWHEQRQQVVCIETVTWKGLPVRDNRLVPYERIDPEDAARVFIRQGLAAEEGLRPVPLVVRNRAVFETAARLRHRLRDPSLWVEREHLEAWYTQRLGPARLASSNALREWLKLHGDDALRLTLADLSSPEAAARAEQGAPETIVMGGKNFRLRYQFLPGDATDGVTIDLTEADLSQVDVLRLEWVVAAWRDELVTALVEQLPKDQRRPLIPLAQTVPKLVAALAPVAGTRPIAQALTEVLAKDYGLRAILDPAEIPPHLRPRFVIKSADGGLVYDGRDPAFLATQAGAGDRLRLLKASWETQPGIAWPGDLPGEGGKVVHGTLVGYVALGRARAADGTVAFKRTVYGSEIAARAWHQDGLEAGLEAVLGPDLEALATAPAPLAVTLKVEKHLGARLGVLRRSFALAAAWEVDRPQIRDQASWDDLVARARVAALAAGRGCDGVLDRAATLVDQTRTRLRQGAKTLVAAQASRSVTECLDRLLGPGWWQRLPSPTLARLDVLLSSHIARLDGKGGGNPTALSDRMVGIFDLWDRHLGTDAARIITALGLGKRVRDLRGLLAESLHALALGQNATQAEHRLRIGLQEVARQVDDARDRIAETRQNLIEAGRLIPRIAVAQRRERIQQELATATRDFPDLTIGCDLPGQHQAAQAVIARVRASL